MVVWKYPLDDDMLNDHMQIDMPAGAQILTFQMQGEVPTLWALVDPKVNAVEPRVFRFAGTGHDIRENRAILGYIGTIQMMGGKLVFHLFEIIRK